MNNETLETYLNIVKTRSLTKTAEYMFISQSAVSNRLAGLEAELGVRLIERSAGKKGIFLTEKGLEFSDYAKRYLELEQQIKDWTSGSSRATLKLASVISLNDYILKDFYQQVLAKRRLSLSLATHWTDRIITMLENREIDIGITPRVFYSKTLDAVPMFREALYLVSSREVSSYPDLVDATQLKRENEIYFDWGRSFVEWHDQQMSPIQPPLMVTDTTSIIDQLLHIPGTFSIIPRSIFKRLNDPELKLSGIDPAPPERTCYLLKLREQRSEQRERIEIFEQEFREYLRGVEDITLL